MKRFFLISTIAAIVFAACKPEEKDVVAELSVSTLSINVSAAGGTESIAVTCNTGWAVSCTEDWIEAEPLSGHGNADLLLRIQSNVKENESSESRSTRIAIVAGDKKKEVRVSQAGNNVLFGGGQGTESEPYRIKTALDLEQFCVEINAGKYLDAHFSITADIDMDGRKYVPAALSADRPFAGVLDGGNHSISNLVYSNVGDGAAKTPAGLVGYARGASIKNINLVNVNIDNDYLFTGSIAGHAVNSTIENCSVSGQVRAYMKSLTIDADGDKIPVAVNNAGLSGGIAGYVEKTTVKNCTMDANATFYGKFSGGVVGYSCNSTIENCGVCKERTVNVYYHYSGGVIGRAIGADNRIMNCWFEGNYTSIGYVVGGIVGQLLGGRVEGCVLGSYALVGADKYYVGGIAGAVQPLSAVVVTKCANYGTVRGYYATGGIVGYVGVGSGASSDKDLILNANGGTVEISDCALVRGSVTSTGGNSAGYPIAGGILGWSHNTQKLTLRGCYSLPGLIQTTYGANKYGVLSGICAYQNNTSGASMENCYSAFGKNDLLVCGDQAAIDESRWYAGVHIRCTQTTTVANCYSLEGMRVGYSSSAATESGCREYSVSDMTNGTMLAALQAASNGTRWIAGADSYPTIEGLPADPHVKPQSAKKVSVIGDSISTFKGWIPGGYSAHYPATDGTLTLVSETYWYRLIHDYMKDAELEVNISFSGSTVTNTTEENYAARYGTASNAWWHNSFTERFAAYGGLGNPDIVIIHGGTNDWAHNADPLAPGVPIRNDQGNDYGGTAPSDAVMNAIFAKADAAVSRAEINALPDGSYCEAYAKLLCQIRERYPRCKVVCIVGDYLNQAIEQSTIQLAEHYGAKVVNLFRVNGFNDLGGYSPSTLNNVGTQPNMPKHDYSGSISGCHPSSECMKFIAEKIYNELGAWLEQ